MKADRDRRGLDRRGFLRSAAGAGAVLALGPVVSRSAESDGSVEPIDVVLIGGGLQGLMLVTACMKIPGIRFRAVCDIWEAYNLKRISRILQHYGHPAVPYTDYQAMLDKEKDVQAAIVATPDFWHARHTLACLEAGLHVYCETPMSNSVQDARRMVEAARHCGKLLQVGQQRRSNPQYVFCREKILQEIDLLGRVVAVNGQWNRLDFWRGWPKKMDIDPAVLAKYGYDSMEQFANWRWYKGLGSGPAVEFGSHQIDVYNWFLEARPASVFVVGGANCTDGATRQWCDTITAVYEYKTSRGMVTASYQVLSTSRYDGYVERFVADQGTLSISERADRTRLFPGMGISPGWASPWYSCLKKGYLTVPPEWRRLLEERHVTEEQFGAFLIDESHPIGEQVSCALPVKVNKPAPQPHLENFFDAIRGTATLNCPGEVGYETVVTVLKINEAIEAGRRLEFKPEDFV